MAGIFGPVLVNYIREYNITHGVPKAQAYNVTMYIMAGLFVIGFICNLPHQGGQQARYHMEPEDGALATAAAAGQSSGCRLSRRPDDRRREKSHDKSQTKAALPRFISCWRGDLSASRLPLGVLQTLANAMKLFQ